MNMTAEDLEICELYESSDYANDSFYEDESITSIPSSPSDCSLQDGHDFLHLDDEPISFGQTKINKKIFGMDSDEVLKVKVDDMTNFDMDSYLSLAALN